MIKINQLRLSIAQPRVAQLHRWAASACNALLSLRPGSFVKRSSAPANNRLERAGVLGEPSRESMIRIIQLRLPLAQPRGAQPHR